MFENTILIQWQHFKELLFWIVAGTNICWSSSSFSTWGSCCQEYIEYLKSKLDVASLVGSFNNLLAKHKNPAGANSSFAFEEHSCFYWSSFGFLQRACPCVCVLAAFNSHCLVGALQWAAVQCKGLVFHIRLLTWLFTCWNYLESSSFSEAQADGRAHLLEGRAALRTDDSSAP